MKTLEIFLVMVACQELYDRQEISFKLRTGKVFFSTIRPTALEDRHTTKKVLFSRLVVDEERLSKNGLNRVRSQGVINTNLYLSMLKISAAIFPAAFFWCNIFVPSF